jgi:hypothetical protein
MEPAGGEAVDARAATIRAFHEAREAGDAGRIAEAALNLPSGQQFGEHPGQIPALIHEAYVAAADPPMQARLAAALARAWVYGGDPPRGAPFADQAVAVADRLGDPVILADALDAALLSRWGPDDFTERLQLSVRLADTAAHLTATEPRLSAHLWRLTTAWECLDVIAVQRQLRALDVLAGETGSPRAAFFAGARRAMYALVTEELEEADRLIARTGELGASTTEPDVEAVTHGLAATRAQRAADTGALRREAAAYEEYGTEQGIPSVSAQGALLWLHAGEPGRARALQQQIAGGGLGSLPRDVYFLLTVCLLVEIAAELKIEQVAADGARLLEPYAGRAVLNAGAVAFHGVVDEYLARAQASLGRPGAAGWRHSAVSCYERIGARWWRDRLAGAPGGAAPATAVTVHFRPNDAAGWIIGRDGATAVLPDVKGLHYLRHLLQRPGLDVEAVDLAAAVAGHPGVTISQGEADVIDAQAASAYRARLADIDTELSEAESWADGSRSGRLRLEREALLGEIAAAAGLGGRRRQFTSAQERARIAVRKAIVAALQRIEEHDSSLARQLRDCVRTGSACRYDPDPARPVAWILDR